MFVAVFAIAAAAPAVAADPLGNRLAELLCYPESASHLNLTPDQLRRLTSPAPVNGWYRDIQGSDARAWFTSENGEGQCRVPATSALDVFFCADVTVTENSAIRSRRYLCR